MFDSLKALHADAVLNTVNNGIFNISLSNDDNIAFTSDYDVSQIAFLSEYVLTGNSAITRLMFDINNSNNPSDLIGVVYTDTITIRDFNALTCNVYTNTHESSLFVSVVLLDGAQAVYSRTLDTLRDELTDGEENDLLDATQCNALDNVFTANMLHAELITHIQSRSVTNTHDNEYGLLLHSMNNICDYYTL